MFCFYQGVSLIKFSKLYHTMYILILIYIHTSPFLLGTVHVKRALYNNDKKQGFESCIRLFWVSFSDFWNYWNPIFWSEFNAFNCIKRNLGVRKQISYIVLVFPLSTFFNFTLFWLALIFVKGGLPTDEYDFFCNIWITISLK